MGFLMETRFPFCILQNGTKMPNNLRQINRLSFRSSERNFRPVVCFRFYRFSVPSSAVSALLAFSGELRASRSAAFRDSSIIFRPAQRLDRDPISHIFRSIHHRAPALIRSWCVFMIDLRLLARFGGGRFPHVSGVPRLLVSLTFPREHRDPH